MKRAASNHVVAWYIKEFMISPNCTNTAEEITRSPSITRIFVAKTYLSSLLTDLLNIWASKSHHLYTYSVLVAFNIITFLAAFASCLPDLKFRLLLNFLFFSVFVVSWLLFQSRHQIIPAHLSLTLHHTCLMRRSQVFLLVHQDQLKSILVFVWVRKFPFCEASVCKFIFHLWAPGHHHFPWHAWPESAAQQQNQDTSE